MTDKLPEWVILDQSNGFEMEITMKRYFVTYGNAKARETAIAEILDKIQDECSDMQIKEKLCILRNKLTREK